MPAKLTAAIEGSDTLGKTERGKLEGIISTKPGLKRFLRTTPGGLLRIDQQKIKAEEKLDGKYLLRTSDPDLSAEDIALGYKQLPEVETCKPGCCHNCCCSALPCVSSPVSVVLAV
jgi:hypothetical protein